MAGAPLLVTAGVPPKGTVEVPLQLLVMTQLDEGKSDHSSSKVMSVSLVAPVSLTSPSTTTMLSDYWEWKRACLLSQT